MSSSSVDGQLLEFHELSLKLVAHLVESFFLENEELRLIISDGSRVSFEVTLHHTVYHFRKQVTVSKVTSHCVANEWDQSGALLQSFLVLIHRVFFFLRNL